MVDTQSTSFASSLTTDLNSGSSPTPSLLATLANSDGLSDSLLPTRVFARASALGSLPLITEEEMNAAQTISLDPGVSSLSGTVSDTTQNVYYRFTLNETRSISLLLNDLTANANVDIYDNTGTSFPTVRQPEDLVGHQPGTIMEAISQVMDSGTYYIRVSEGESGANARYTLSLFNTSAASDPGVRMVEMHNFYRTQFGLPALKLDDAITRAAQAHSQDLADHNLFGHTGSDGSEFWDRLKREGYDWAAGESVSGGVSPESALQGLMNDNHRLSPISPDVTEMGVGYVNTPQGGGIWTADYGSRGFKSNFDKTDPINVGSQLVASSDFGSIAAGASDYRRDSIGTSNRESVPDVLFKFTLETPTDTTTNLSMSLSNLFLPANLHLIQDSNNNGVFDEGEEITVNRLTPEQPLEISTGGVTQLNMHGATFTASNLTSGTYYVDVRLGEFNRDDHSYTPFRLDLSVIA